MTKYNATQKKMISKAAKEYVKMMRAGKKTEALALREKALSEVEGA